MFPIENDNESNLGFIKPNPKPNPPPPNPPPILILLPVEEVVVELPILIPVQTSIPEIERYVF